MDIKSVGVIGCGTMGLGIVQLCSQHGYPVTVSEINQTFLDNGLASLKISLTKCVEKGKFSQQEKESVLSRIKGTLNLRDLRVCDLIIEAVTENLELKKKLFKELDQICPENTILATNTSCLSIMDMAMATQRPAKVLGLHFFNPIPQMGLIELVSTLVTGSETINTCKTFSESLGKTVVSAVDSPGFIVNRLAFPFILNAIRMLESGAASRDDIDKAVQLGLNHPIGPLALADLVGLDVVYSIGASLYDELKEPHFIPPVLLKKMVAAGWLGRKTQKGFYEYGKSQTKPM